MWSHNVLIINVFSSPWPDTSLSDVPVLCKSFAGRVCQILYFYRSVHGGLSPFLRPLNLCGYTTESLTHDQCDTRSVANANEQYSFAIPQRVAGSVCQWGWLHFTWYISETSPVSLLIMFDKWHFIYVTNAITAKWPLEYLGGWPFENKLGLI